MNWRSWRYSLIYVVIFGILCLILGIWVATSEKEERTIPQPPYTEFNSEHCGFCLSLYERQMRMFYEFDGTVWNIRTELRECYDRLWKESVQLDNFENPQVEM